MKKLFKYLAVMGFSVLAASCEAELVSPDLDKTSQVAFIIEDFIPEGRTKSATQIIDSDSELHFQWSENDIIGIFPDDGWQTQFNMEEGAGTNTAVFDGGSWGLKKEAVYYAYYPFSKENFESMERRERVSYSYEGQEACFADENGLIDLSGYDFMATGASTVENGNVTFNFKHLGALCKISFKSPVSTGYSQTTIKADSEVFSLTGHYDATSENVELVSEGEKSNQFVIKFPAENHFEPKDIVELYFLMPPVDLSSQPLKLSIVDTDNNFYESEIAGRNIQAGMSYAWDVVFDLDTEPQPLGTETANCYIVSKAGSYNFKAVKGNSSESVGAVASAEVLWESFGTDMAPNVGDIISDVIYSDGHISFNASNKKGNAVIAAKDAAGKILWSWHIWLTAKPKDQVYNNNAGTMMDRNLGATSATPGDVGALGLLYQWGRKDSFLGSSSISSSTKAKSTLSWPSSVFSDPSTGTISYAIEHPTTFIVYNYPNVDWYYTGSNTTDDTRWQSVKTIYDPCPSGYRVPDGGNNGVWSTAFDSSGSYPSFDSTSRGFNFGYSGTTNSLTSEPTCWYPAAGYLDHDDGYLYNVGYGGYYWSCSPSDVHAYGLFFYNAGYVSPWYNTFRAYGVSVRCVRE